MINGEVKIDEYCPSCGENRVFAMQPMDYYKQTEFHVTYVPAFIAKELEFLQQFIYKKTIENEERYRYKQCGRPYERLGYPRIRCFG